MSDTNLTELKQGIDELGSSWQEYQQVNDRRIEELAKGNKARADELDAELKKRDEDINKLTQQRNDLQTQVKSFEQRLDELEADAAMPGALLSKKIENTHVKMFERWIRSSGKNYQLGEELKKLEHQHKQAKAYETLGTKDITIGTDAAGGFAVPEVIANQIEMLEKKISPVRDLVKVVETSTSDYKELVSIGGATSGWVGETGTRTATSTPELRERTPTNGELYAYPQMSEWASDDIFFNVSNWLTNEVADSFAEAESTAVLTGDGSNKPTGIFNTAPVSTADWASPLRAAAAIQYVPMNSSPVALSGDDVFDLVYTLNRRYRPGAVFTANSLSIGAIRKLKDGNSQYLWAPGLQAGQPDVLVGYPIRTWEQMADFATNSLSLAFGDFRRGYVLANRVNLRITVENVTNIGYVRFYVRRREGGCVLNNDAIKVLKQAAS